MGFLPDLGRTIRIEWGIATSNVPLIAGVNRAPEGKVSFRGRLDLRNRSEEPRPGASLPRLDLRNAHRVPVSLDGSGRTTGGIDAENVHLNHQNRANQGGHRDLGVSEVHCLNRGKGKRHGYQGPSKVHFRFPLSFSARLARWAR